MDEKCKVKRNESKDACAKSITDRDSVFGSVLRLHFSRLAPRRTAIGRLSACLESGLVVLLLISCFASHLDVVYALSEGRWVGRLLKLGEFGVLLNPVIETG